MTGAAPLEELIALIEASTHVLIDFDGPICKVFSGLSAEDLATKLLKLLAIDGANIPPELQKIADPLEVLRFAGTVGRNEADRVDSMLREAELQAVDSAIPTTGASELIIACRRTDREIGIVSNNSQAAVEKYLRARDLAQHVRYIAARTQSDPDLLKPNPHLIHRSLRAFGCTPNSFVLVGDSVSDIEAARAAGISHIGYANKQAKINRLAEAGANAVITSLAELTSAVLTSPRSDRGKQRGVT